MNDAAVTSVTSLMAGSSAARVIEARAARRLQRLKPPPADWQLPVDAASEIGLSEYRMSRLLVAGGIPTKCFLFQGGSAQYVPRGLSIETLWRTFIDRNARPKSIEQLLKVRRVAELLKLSRLFEWPDGYFDALLTVLNKAGLPLIVKEAQALVRGKQTLISRLFRNALERRGLSPASFDRVTRSPATVAQFRAALLNIDGMVGTVLAEPDEVVEKLLAPRERGAIVALPAGRLRNAIGLYACVKCFGPDKVSSTHRLNVTHDGAILSKILDAVDLCDSAATDRAIRGYAFGPLRGSGDSRKTRRRVGARWVTFANLWKSHQESFPETKRQLRSSMPVFPERIALLASNLQYLDIKLGRAAKKRRKATTDPIADAPDETEAVLEAKSAQIENWTREFLEAKAIVERDPARDLSQYTFIDDVVPENGIPDGATQIVCCTAVRLDVLRHDLWKNADPAQKAALGHYLDGGRNYESGDRQIIVCVFNAVRKASGSSGPAIVPTFVRLHASGCLANPSGMKPAKLVERAALIKEWDLPFWSAPPLGLISPAGREVGVAAHALRQECVVLHLEEFRHSARYGRVAGRLSIRNGMRAGEAFQLRWQLSGFGFARVNGDVRIGIRAFPKGWTRQRLFLLDDVTFVAITELVQLTIARFFPSSPAFHLPRVNMPGLQPSVGPEGHAVFQGQAGVLKNSIVNRSYRLLMAGSPKNLMHDRRHVFANTAAMDGLELEDISDLLSQEGRSLAAYYAAATQRQVAMHSERLHRAADDRAALR